MSCRKETRIAEIFSPYRNMSTNVFGAVDMSSDPSADQAVRSLAVIRSDIPSVHKTWIIPSP